MPRIKDMTCIETFGPVMFNTRTWEENTQVVDPVTGCIPWQGGAWHVQKYGMVTMWDAKSGKKKMTTAHRASYIMNVESSITRSDYIIHTCGNHACVNPAHLFRGTNSGDSVRIKKENGRWIKRQSRYGHRKSQVNRVYRFTVEQLIYTRNHTTREVQQYFNMSKRDSYLLRHYCNTKYGLKWIAAIEHKYDTNGVMKPGYKPELSVEFK